MKAFFRLKQRESLPLLNKGQASLIYSSKHLAAVFIILDEILGSFAPFRAIPAQEGLFTLVSKELSLNPDQCKIL
jgi:hypothetical protein